MDFAVDVEELCQRIQNCIQSYQESGMNKTIKEEISNIKTSLLELQDKIPQIMQTMSEQLNDHVKILEDLQKIDQSRRIIELSFSILKELETSPQMTKVRSLSFALMHRYSVTK